MTGGARTLALTCIMLGSILTFHALTLGRLPQSSFLRQSPTALSVAALGE
jgi:hypothetical protein